MADKKTSSHATTGKAVTSAKGKTAGSGTNGKVPEGVEDVGSVTPGEAKDAAAAGRRRVAEAAGTTGRAGQLVSQGAAVAREKAAAVPGKAVATAGTAWTVLRARKAVAIAAGTGVTAVCSASYLAGRHAAKSGFGPLTRATGGRI
ncbi:hypothetical protein [Streptomyces daliensis]